MHAVVGPINPAHKLTRSAAARFLSKHTHKHTCTQNHTHSSCVFGGCERVFWILWQSECVYTWAREILVSVSSLSLPVTFSPLSEIRNFMDSSWLYRNGTLDRGLVTSPRAWTCDFLPPSWSVSYVISLLCVSSMSICEAAISNLVRSFLFGRSVIDRFDTVIDNMMPGVPGYTQTLLPRSLPPTHTTYTHREREREPPPLSITHTYKRETDINWESVCICVCDV